MTAPWAFEPSSQFPIHAFPPWSIGEKLGLGLGLGMGQGLAMSGFLAEAAVDESQYYVLFRWNRHLFSGSVLKNKNMKA